MRMHRLKHEVGQMSHHHRFDLARMIRHCFCAVFCPCRHKHRGPRGCTITLDFGHCSTTFNYHEGEKFMAVVIKTGGPLKMDVSDFVDDKGNPVVDTDPAVYTSSDETIATVVNDPDDAQDGIITLTGTVSPPDTAVTITATFPAQRGGSEFKVVGSLIVIEPAAAGAQAKISGPGVVEGA